jgi:phospholipase/lecithinase/hemolysin
MKAATYLMVATSCVFFASQAVAATYNNLFVFGDSTVDSGWWAGALATPAQCGGVTAPCETGSTGKDTLISNAIAAGGSPPANGAPVGAGNMNNVQDLAAKFGLTANPANQPGGTNYAISGALSAPVGGSGNLNSNTNLPSTMTQIANYLTVHPTADASALYVISSGGNDVTYANDNFTTLAAKEMFLSGQATALAGEISSLQTAGAKSIVVYGLQGSGTLPTFMTNTLFSDLKANGVNFLDIDIAGLIATVEANPTAYGFAAATVLPGIVGTTTGSACVTQTGASSTTTGWGQWCANTTTPSSSHAYLRSATSEQTSFWTDDQHLSAAGQQIEANFVFDQITGTPVPTAFPLFATGLGALGLFGWRRKRKTQAVAA